MKLWLQALFLAAVASAGQAQEFVSPGTGAVLRGLDKLTGQVTDMTLANGATGKLGRLRVELAECRYPEGDVVADAFAFLTIRDGEVDEPPVFSGWMMASSPALNAMEHPRYDLWVLRCTLEGGASQSGSDVIDAE